MMKWVFFGLFVLSIVFGAMNGRMAEVSTAAISESGNAITLVLSISGALIFWSGIMKVAQESGVTVTISKILSVFTRFLFPSLPPDSAAAQAISMNITSNILGLGNAATPLGITAMTELEKLENTNGTASDNMIMFVVLNTASLQLIPTTIAALRVKNGSMTPLDILPAVLASSLCAAAVGVTAAMILRVRNRRLRQK